MLQNLGAPSSQLRPCGSGNPASEFDFDSRRSFYPHFTQTSAVAAAVGPLVHRLQGLCPLSQEAIRAIEKLTPDSHVRAAGHPLFQEHTRCSHISVLTDGVACRYRMFPEGRRQILGYILPGDICDPQFLTAGRLDHSVNLLTKGAVANIPTLKFIELLAAFPTVRRAIEVAALIDTAILRQWLMNMAQRSASERLAHFLCEYLVRMEQIGGLGHNGAVTFEINQVALADTLGMSTVHVNRTLQALRAADLILLRKRQLHVLDRHRLVEMSNFNPNYLQIRDDFREAATDLRRT